jgi:hypothetical protein
MINDIELAQDICEYILDDGREECDFARNPSRDHVYYKAFRIIRGKDAAEKILNHYLTLRDF